MIDKMMVAAYMVAVMTLAATAEWAAVAAWG